MDRRFDLRVEDHPTPVAELRRLVQLARAYHKLNEGDEWITAGDMDAAMTAYSQAIELVADEATGGKLPSGWARHWPPLTGWRKRSPTCDGRRPSTIDGQI